MIDILYNDSGCNHSPDVISVMQNIITEFLTDFTQTQELIRIDRWNIYQPDTLHIVYIFRRKWDKPGSLSSAELKCNIREFQTRWREIKLTELGI